MDLEASSRSLIFRRVFHPLVRRAPGEARYLSGLELMDQLAMAVRRALTEVRVVHTLELIPELELGLAIEAVLPLLRGRALRCRSSHRSSRPSRLIVVIHGMSSAASPHA